MERIIKASHMIMVISVFVLVMIAFIMLMSSKTTTREQYVFINSIYYFVIVTFLVSTRKATEYLLKKKLSGNTSIIESVQSNRALKILRAIIVILIGIFLFLLFAMNSPQWALLFVAAIIFNNSDLIKIVRNEQAVSVSDMIVWYNQVDEYGGTESFLYNSVTITLKNGISKTLPCQSKYHCRRILELLDENVERS